MGRKLDALLGRNRHLKPSKFKALVNVATSRTTILKNQHQARCSLARADVLQLLNLGYQTRALLRVEVVVKENNMLDALGMIEDYCYLLVERVALLQMNKECPDELKEAISSLIYAASRCGEFPELKEIRRIFEIKFGREFSSSAIDLRNNCGVSPKMIQKFSTRQPNAETKLKVLKEIASENHITLHLEEEPAIIIKEKLNQKQEAKKSADLNNPEVINATNNLHEDIFGDESESIRAKKFKDVASAAREAFQSAAYAAVAARAVIELSRSESHEVDRDHEDGSHLQRNLTSDLDSSDAPKPKLNVEDASISSDRFSFEKIDPVESSSSESEGENMAESNQEIHVKHADELPEKPAIESMSSIPTSDSDISNLKEQSLNPNSIIQDEPENDKLVANREDEVASKDEISDMDIVVHKSK